VAASLEQHQAPSQVPGTAAAEKESKIFELMKDWNDKAEKLTFLARVADNAG